MIVPVEELPPLPLDSSFDSIRDDEFVSDNADVVMEEIGVNVQQEPLPTSIEIIVNPLTEKVKEIPKLMSLKVEKPKDFQKPIRGDRPGMKDHCYNCGGLGHFQYQCKDKGKYNGPRCPVCFEIGVTRETCPRCINF